MSPDGPWVILLAGGEGVRLREIATDPQGWPAPKQYCAFGTRETLMTRSLRRARTLAGRDRVVPVVAEGHWSWWSRELVGHPQAAIAVQPKNRGTAVGTLFPLLRILRRDPDALVILMPSDHFVDDEPAFMRSLRLALEHARTPSAAIVLLGITPESAEGDYGWIVPSGPSMPRTVESFVEKPGAEHAGRLWERGGLWNSLVCAFRGRALLDLFRCTQSQVVDAFAGHARTGDGDFTDVRGLYDEVPARDLSRDVLEPAPHRLRVLTAAPCGWTDLGTPARLEKWRQRPRRDPRDADVARASQVWSAPSRPYSIPSAGR